ncbi:MAG: tol-pal system-associated acyl-CoA thioesterase [Rhodospirillales bacterium]|nr:tol-pal system-associated acyl-CoA thioesterase [Rhodospirillales bacterium]
MSDAAGRLEGATHVFPIRVYYEDTDAGGVVYYANSLRFAERARTDLLRILGVEQSRLAESEGVAFVVRRCAAEFVGAAHLDEKLEVRTRLSAVKGATLDAEQVVCRDGAELVRMDVRVACVNTAGEGRPTRIPAGIRTSLQRLNGSD